MITWIPEKEFAKKVGRSPLTIRRLVKSGHWDIDFTAPNGRTFFYDEKGVNKMLESYSSITTSKTNGLPAMGLTCRSNRLGEMDIDKLKLIFKNIQHEATQPAAETL